MSDSFSEIDKQKSLKILQFCREPQVVTNIQCHVRGRWESLKKILCVLVDEGLLNKIEIPVRLGHGRGHSLLAGKPRFRTVTKYQTVNEVYLLIVIGGKESVSPTLSRAIDCNMETDLRSCHGNFNIGKLHSYVYTNSLAPPQSAGATDSPQIKETT